MLNLNDELIENCKNGNLDVVKFLVSKGSDIHAGDNDALRWASNNGHLNVVEVLVSKGANIHAGDNDALRWASNNGHLDVVEFLKSCDVKTNRQKKIMELQDKLDELKKLEEMK